MLREVIKKTIFNKSKNEAMEGKHSDAGRNKSSSVTVIGRDAIFTGTISSQGSIEILGAMDGKVSSSCITIREGGSFTGELKSQVLNVQGKVNAQIQTESILVFHKGIVSGSVSYKKIKIEDGGQVNGKLNPTSEEEFKRPNHRVNSTD